MKPLQQQMSSFLYKMFICNFWEMGDGFEQPAADLLITAVAMEAHIQSNAHGIIIR